MSAEHAPDLHETAPMKNRWGAVFSVALGVFSLVVCEYLPVGILGPMASSMGVSEGRAGLVMTVPGFVAAIAAPILTVIGGLRNRRPILLSFVVALLVSNLVSALAPSFGVLLLGRALLGVSIGGFWAIGPSLGNRLVESKSAARATSIIFAAISAATVLGVPAGKIVGDALGWRASFGVTALMAGIALAAQTFSLPELKAVRRVQPRDLLWILGNSASRLGLVMTILTFAGHFAAYTYVTPFLRADARLSSGAISTILLLYGAMGIAGTFVVGMAAEGGLRKALLRIVSLLAVSILILPACRTSSMALVALVMGWGFASGGVILALQTWMTRAASDVPEGGSALFVSTTQISVAAGAFIGGLAVDHFGNLGAMFLGGSLPALALLVFSAYGHRARQAAL